MRDKRDLPSRELDRRASRAVPDYDERMPQRKSKVTGSQDDRDRDGPRPRRRSIAIRPYERERDRDSTSYYQGRSSHSSRLMSLEEAQKATSTLYVQVKETMSFFAKFKEEYQREVRGIEAYADQTILDKLWEYKRRVKDSKSRSSKVRSKDDGVGARSVFEDVSTRLWDNLNAAYDGAISHPSGANDSMARKLETAIRDIEKYLVSVRTKAQEVDGMIKELKVLKVVLELDGAGTESHDNRANQRPKIHATSHEHLRDSSPQREDERYRGMGDESDDEVDSQRDKQHGEHSERSGERQESEVGGDGEAQGPFPMDQSALSTTDVK